MKTPIALKSTNVFRACFLLLFMLFVKNTDVFAQVDTTQVNQKLIIGRKIIIETKDGSVIQGQYMGQTENGIRVSMEKVGDIIVPNNQIAWMEVMDDRYKDGQYWFENPSSTRYLFSPSAFSLRKGEAYYQNTYLLFNSFNYGVTDNFTIGGGFELYSLVSGDPIFFISPKYSFKISDKFRAGTGVLYINAVNNRAGFSGLGIGYGILTYGNKDNNITAGIGYGFVENELTEKPLFTLSGMTRLSKRIGFVSENWITPINGGTYGISDGRTYGIYSYGLRFMGERLTVDLAFLNNRDFNDFLPIGIPYIDFVVKLGKRKRGQTYQTPQ